LRGQPASDGREAAVTDWWHQVQVQDLALLPPLLLPPLEGAVDMLDGCSRA